MLENKEKKEIEPFRFKQFEVAQDRCAMKVGTDGVLLGAWADVQQAHSILDIGTGTGLIALMLAQRSNAARIHAVEIDAQACEQARENMDQSVWASRLQAINEPIQNYARQSSEIYDLIVSNPPFFSGGTFSHNHLRNNVRHTIKLPNGDLLQAARTLLADTGKFCVILPFLEGLRFEEMAQRYRLYCTRCTEVRSRTHKAPERLLLQFEKIPSVPKRDHLVLYIEDTQDPSEAYRHLTDAFYLNI